MNFENNNKSISLNENNNNNSIKTDDNNIINTNTPDENNNNNNELKLYNKKLYLNKDFKEIKRFDINNNIKLTINKKIDDSSHWFDIRKYYNNKPTKKGILMTIEDLNKLKTIIINNLNTY